MKIGEFAKMTGMPISVLRHYDKEGLLCPDYVDRFSGYRYYSTDQIGQVQKIALLKRSGLSLKEIRDILKNAGDHEFIMGILKQRESEDRNMLAAIEEVKHMMIEKEEKRTKVEQETLSAVEENAFGEMLIKGMSLPLPLDPKALQAAWRSLDEEIQRRNFQRISGFMTYGDKDREIYFLPGGEDYWIYSWTKGYLKLNGGDQSCLCRYQVEDDEGSRYMFVENKSYEYLRGGMPTVLVLEQVDKNRYTKREIAREDDTDMPFVNDERVLGDWKAFDFIRNREEFAPGVNHLPQERLFFKHMHFGEDGFLSSVYMDETMSGKEIQSWTKGYVLKYYNHTACAYEIVTVDGMDYMMIEWKSGDYRWGGYDTDYYVFVRDEE